MFYDTLNLEALKEATRVEYTSMHMVNFIFDKNNFAKNIISVFGIEIGTYVSWSEVNSSELEFYEFNYGAVSGRNYSSFVKYTSPVLNKSGKILFSNSKLNSVPSRPIDTMYASLELGVFIFYLLNPNERLEIFKKFDFSPLKEKGVTYLTTKATDS